MILCSTTRTSGWLDALTAWETRFPRRAIRSARSSSRSSEAKARSSGANLGLYIVKELEAHGDVVTVAWCDDRLRATVSLIRRPPDPSA